MVCTVITADKANRLFWLGRYAERVYISLHLLRRYYDKVIDGDIANLKEYYSFLGVNTSHSDELSEECQLSQLYDQSNICSIASSLGGANDNGIVLRRDITSESLSYIQMSQALLSECAVRCEKNITLLQPVTDYMLAFFGSIDERVFDENISKFLRAGRMVENIDLHLRFRYPFFRVEKAYLALKEIVKSVGAVVDTDSIEVLDELISPKRYHPEVESYRTRILTNLNNILLV
ncbi:MAG: alpha-E domain-containing protein [Rikenellaceae bacterium]